MAAVIKECWYVGALTRKTARNSSALIVSVVIDNHFN